MARPVDLAQRERIHTALLDAARTLVVRDGHERCSLRAVAQMAGISPASVYDHFENREALLAALGRRAAERLGKRLARERDLLGLGAAYLRFARKEPEDFLLLFSRLVSVRRSPEQADGKSPYDLVRAAASRELPAADPDHVAYAVWCLVHGAAMLRLTHLAGFEADFASADAAALTALIRGFA